MKKIFIILSAGLLFLCGCKHSENKNPMYSGDTTFQQLADNFIQGYLSWRPQLAVYLGYHDYDGKITDFSTKSVDSELTRLKDYENKLSAISHESLSPKMYFDLRILMSGIKKEIFNFQDMGAYNRNPMTYAGALDVNIYISRDFALLENRVRSIIDIENHAPEIFAAARSNLKDSLPLPYIQLAMQIAKGSADFLGHDLVTALKGEKNDTLMKSFKAANKIAISQLNSFTEWLKKEKLPKANNKYAIGEASYRKMLEAEYIDVAPEKILSMGMEALKKEQENFNATAKIIDPNKRPIDVYHVMQKEHPVADSLIPRTREDLETIRKFIIDKKLVTIPSEVRATVKETPQYMRSTSTASMDTPGPFETKTTEAYYYVTPVDPAWTPKQKEDWLRMFDYYTMDNVSVHEAYPGHYVQFLHLNASSATRIEKIFWSYAYVEGWAHYCEKMMIDEGFRRNEGPVTAAKYKLAQSGDALLRLCRLCVSIKMHCQGMTVKQGTKFFMDNWYQGEEPSHEEAMRGTFDPGYLFYTLGKMEILKLRKDYMEQEGTNYSLEKFNDLILDHGMPPLRLLREVILTDSTQWNAIL